MRPRWNDRGPHKREAEGVWKQTPSCDNGGRDWRERPQAQGRLEPPRAARSRKDCSPQRLEGAGRAPGDVLGLHDWPPARGTTQPCSSRATWSWASAAWAGNTDASRNVRQHGDGRRQLPASPRRPRRRGKSGAQDAPPVLRHAGY